MNENKMMQKISAIFSIFMVLFYFGAGIFLIFYFKSNLNSALIKMFGAVLIFYGLFRGYTSFVNIYKLFFKNDDSEE